MGTIIMLKIPARRLIRKILGPTWNVVDMYTFNNQPFASFYHPMNFFNNFYGIYVLRRRKTQTSNIQVVLTYYKLFRLVSHKVVWLIFVISLARLKSFIYSRLMHLTNTLMSKQLIELKSNTEIKFSCNLFIISKFGN